MRDHRGFLMPARGELRVEPGHVHTRKMGRGMAIAPRITRGLCARREGPAGLEAYRHDERAHGDVTLSRHLALGHKVREGNAVRGAHPRRRLTGDEITKAHGEVAVHAPR